MVGAGTHTQHVERKTFSRTLDDETRWETGERVKGIKEGTRTSPKGFYLIIILETENREKMQLLESC